VESGEQGAVFCVFTKLYTAPDYIANAASLHWFRNGGTEVMAWGLFCGHDRFYNSRCIRVSIGSLLVCSMQFWAAGLGVDCGWHDHSELTVGTTFGETHVCLYNGSGQGGVIYKSLDSAGAEVEAHITVHEGEEHKPLFWMPDRSGIVKYPLHKWVAGTAKGGERYDIWAAFEHRPIPLLDSIAIQPFYIQQPERVTPAVAEGHENARCHCSSAACIL
jgi:hypothetical protein